MDSVRLDKVPDSDWVGRVNKCDLNRRMFLVCEGCRVLVECQHGRLTQESPGYRLAKETDHPNCPNLHSRSIEQVYW
jgi:hypothetical protein